MNLGEMDTLPSTSEIVESIEGLENELSMGGRNGKHIMPNSGNKYSIEDNINRLFEAIDIRTSASRDGLRKSAMKRPVRPGSSQASGIGISEHVSLKQALRGLCISQASEMAAMKKKLLKPSGSLGVSEAGAIKRLYRTVVVEANGSGLRLNESKGNLVKISLIPEKVTSYSSEDMIESLQVPFTEFPNQSTHSSSPSDSATKLKAVMTKLPSLDQIVPLETVSGSKVSNAGFSTKNLRHDAPPICNGEKVQELEVISPAWTDVPAKPSIPDGDQKDKLHSGALLNSPIVYSKVNNSVSNTPRLLKPVFRNKSFIKRKVKQGSTFCSSSHPFNGNVSNDLGLSTSYSDCRSTNHTAKDESEENLKASPASSSKNNSIEVNSNTVDTCGSKPEISLNCGNPIKLTVAKADERSRFREKGEFSQSSKSSIGDYSSTTSISEESSLSGSNRIGSRPHMSKDARWEAIHLVQKQYGSLGLRQFKLLRKLGCGDIGTVYLAELMGTNCLFALKVMDTEFLMSRKKMPRAETEREILQMLDHPFLPTLYAHFATEKLSCLVMEYCPGGDLHVLRQKQPCRSFSEHAARY